MKKLWMMLAALLCLCVLAGCSAAPMPTPTEATPAPTEQTDAPTEPTDVFTFTRENFPRMDGSTAMVPLGEAIASVLLGESREDVADLVNFNRTTQSFRNLTDHQCDVLVVGEPNAVVFDEMKERGFEYEMETICNDALIFVVNENNPVDNLTTEQVRKIYAGEITNWKEVGGEDAEIVAFQRNEGAGSQALMLKHIMKDTPMMDAPEGYVAMGMGELMEVVRSYDNSANAIGYSVYYYANDMQMAKGLKILSIDGVRPSAETIRNEEYPHRNAAYCVIPADAEADSPNRILYEWLVSEAGQRLVANEGYVSVMAFDE